MFYSPKELKPKWIIVFPTSLCTRPFVFQQLVFEVPGPFRALQSSPESNPTPIRLEPIGLLSRQGHSHTIRSTSYPLLSGLQNLLS